MKTPTNEVQIIKQGGKPAFAVVPYDQWLELISQKDKENTEIVEETPIFHIVKEGENLYRISLMYNIKMVTLQTWNNLENTGAIFAGKKLWLVPPSMQED